MNSKLKQPIPDQSRKLKIISIALSCILSLAVPPAIPIFLMAGVATAMMSASNPNDTILALITIATYVFWAVPILMVVCLVAAQKLRKKYKFTKSIILQAISLTVFFAFVFIIFFDMN